MLHIRVGTRPPHLSTVFETPEALHLRVLIVREGGITQNISSCGALAGGRRGITNALPQGLHLALMMMAGRGGGYNYCECLTYRK